MSVCRCQLFALSSRSRLSNVFLTAQRGAFWSRKKPTPEEAEADVEKALTKPTQRKYLAGEDGHLMKEDLNRLGSKTILTTRKSYEPPSDVEARIQSIISQSLQVDGDWRDMSLQEPRTKYKVLTKLISAFSHDIPSVEMSKMNNVSDVLAFFQTPVHATNTYEDLSRLKDLPPNLHIQQEYIRFDPETDTMFGGRTAYPGQDTHVTSIKYKRKYASIKTTKEKPGYVNHYFGY